MEEMDHCILRIMEKLDVLQLSDNTIVYFSSDNGGHREEYNTVKKQLEGGWNGIFRGTSLGKRRVATPLDFLLHFHFSF